MKISYLNNILLMEKLSESVGAKFVAGIFELRTVNKPLIKKEIVEKYNIDNYVTALNNQELNQISILPNHRLNQSKFENRIMYNNRLMNIKKELNILGKQNNFLFFDLMPIADKAPQDLELFSTSIHFTNAGSDYLIKSSIKKILNFMNK